MPDRDYVINELKYLHDRETWKEGLTKFDDHPEDRRKITADALSLLKAQEPVVRCKDCKYCEYPKSEKGWCKKGHLHGNAETWFCADGERNDA